MRTGILGGTFNPIHLAHLKIAEEVLRAFSLDQILFIPAADPPHKEVDQDVSFAHRFAMVEKAIAGQPLFTVSNLEQQRHGKSFSVDTLEVLSQKDPGGERYFIIGLDSYRDIASWKDFRKIFSLCHLVVLARPGVHLPDPLSPLPVAIRPDFWYDETSKKIIHKSGNCVYFLSKTFLDISSTQIRQRLNTGQPVDHLIPSCVAQYIEDHHLYGPSPSPRSE